MYFFLFLLHSFFIFYLNRSFSCVAGIGNHSEQTGFALKKSLDRSFLGSVHFFFRETKKEFPIITK
jgi:hypothetical protein